MSWEVHGIFEAQTFQDSFDAAEEFFSRIEVYRTMGRTTGAVSKLGHYVSLWCNPGRPNADPYRVTYFWIDLDGDEGWDFSA